MNGIHFGRCYRRVLVLTSVLSALATTCGCGRASEPTPHLIIHQVTSLADLAFPGERQKLEAVAALEVKRFADAQAKIWDQSPQLIHVRTKHFILRPSGHPVEVGSWVFVYKNLESDAWLGVLVGSSGVIDVGQRKAAPSELSAWPAIVNWREETPRSIDSYSRFLYGVEFESEPTPVWYASRQGVGADRLIDARSGRDLGYSEAIIAPIVAQINDRPVLW